MLRHRRRLLLFLCVGATCFVAQYTVLTALAGAGTSRPLANALGFAISAQLNFALSARLTWRDRSAGTGRGLLARWISYNGTALISLAVNTAAFTVTYQRVGSLAAAAAGVLSGMLVTYLVCDLLIFRDSRRPRTAGAASQPAEAADPALAVSWGSQPVAASWDQP